MFTEETDLKKKAIREPVETERTRTRKVFVPKTDIYESGDAIVLVADMPGVDEKTIDITLEKNVLTINGTVEPDDFTGYGAVYAEYDIGDYQRAFTVSNEIDRDKIEAKVKNGVLKVTLHKAEQLKARKIAISKA